MRNYAFIIAAAFAIAGCGSSTPVADAPKDEKPSVESPKPTDIDTGKTAPPVESPRPTPDFVTEVTATELGVPYYPNSKPRSRGQMTLDTPEAMSYGSWRRTGDSADKVFDFYKTELQKAGYTAGAPVVHGEMSVVEGKKGKETLTVSYSRDKVKNENEIMVSHVTAK